MNHFAVQVVLFVSFEGMTCTGEEPASKCNIIKQLGIFE
jgi:hypothetical protein